MLPSHRARLAAAARWGCTVAAVALVAAWIASGWVGVIAFYESPASRGVAIGAGEGTLMAGTIAAGWLPSRGAKWSRIDPPLWRWGFRTEAGGAFRF
jgi:hypothetical protein